jgi:hypothetical protein
MPKFLFILVFVLFLGLTNISCKKNPVAPQPVPVSLTVADVGTTEAWLTIGFTGGGDFSVSRNGATILQGHFSGDDTTVVDDSLAPEKSYTYTGSKIENGKVTGTSQPLQVTTLDTTSNNFTWQTFTFGQQGNSSVLNDVTIINDTLAYAVGEIYLNDSTGQPDPLPYNLAKWNGKSWQLQKVPYYYEGQAFYHPIQTIYAFGSNNIWFGGNGLIHWDGINFIPVDISDVWGAYQINKIWGTGNDLYIVGDDGSMAHFDGTSWTKLESGTNQDLYDIFSANGDNIYASGGNYANLTGIVLENKNNVWQTLIEGSNIDSENVFKPDFAGTAATVWVSPTNTVYFGGQLLYRYKFGQCDFVRSLPGNYFGENGNAQNWGLINKIRGVADNDMVIVGERNTIRSFNGVSWRQIGMPYDPASDYDWLSVDMKGNTVIAVGRYGDNAAAIVFSNAQN